MHLIVAHATATAPSDWLGLPIQAVKRPAPLTPSPLLAPSPLPEPMPTLPPNLWG